MVVPVGRAMVEAPSWLARISERGCRSSMVGLSTPLAPLPALLLPALRLPHTQAPLSAIIELAPSINRA